MTRTYTEKDKSQVLRDLAIVPLNGMVNSRQAARILSQRAAIEIGKQHTYRYDLIRRRVKSGTLKVAMQVHERTNLFFVDDIFAMELHPEKWHSERGKNNQFAKRRKTHIKTP